MYQRMSEANLSTRILNLLRNPDLTQNVAVKCAVGIAVVILVAMMFPRGESIELDYKVGAVWAQKDLIAPFSFPVYRDERDYAEDVEKARRLVYPVFERDERALDRQLARVSEFMTRLRGAARLWRSFQENKATNPARALDDSTRFAELAGQLEIPIQEAEWRAISVLEAGTGLERMEQILRDALAAYVRVGILDRRKSTLHRSEIALRRGTYEDIMSVTRLYDQAEVGALLDQHLRTIYGDQETASSIAYRIGMMLLSPTVLFDKTATDQAIQAAVDGVPRSTGFVQENERIVSKHERITPETRLKLESLRRAKAERGAGSATALQLMGIILHVAVVLSLYALYFYHFRKRIFSNNRHLALVALLIALTSLFAYATRELNVTAPVEFLIFVPAASMLLTIVFDSRVGFYGTVTVALLVAGIRGNDYSIALASIVAGALSVYSVRDMKNRTQIFRSLGFIFLGYAVAVVALALERFEAVGIVLEQLAFALINSIVSPVLTYGLLIFVERVFKVTTDLTLIELSHFNHPLLRLLAERAPGTYHHSMTMANLAEAAAVAVGANEVLARVGAFFHDVGKIEKPSYFVENQKGTRSRHDKLAPRMSSLIIQSHVKEGMALARQYKLPEEVVEFIPMHHGTTRVEFFYNKALKLAAAGEGEARVDEIIEQDYRYPGPKPQTKETGIMMLADAIEATARTLDDPAPQKLEALIDDLIKKRFEEGELDECPLTLKDLTKIKKAFLGVLVGIYHSRVKYPEAGGEQESVPLTSTASSRERLSRTIQQIDRG